MADEFTARLLTEAEYDQWDRLVEASPTGSTYNTSWWVGTLAREMGARMEVIGCFLGENLCGGCAAYIRKVRGATRVVFPPTTPYNGFVLEDPQIDNYRRQLLHNLSASGALAAFMEQRYDEIRLRHHFRFSDIRGLTWRGWTSSVHYTYVMHPAPLDELLSRCSRGIKRAMGRARNAGLSSEECNDLTLFMPLYEMTYHKQGLPVPIHFEALNALFQQARERDAARLFVTSDPDGRVLSGRIHLFSGEQVNNWLLGSDPERLHDGVATYTQLYSLSQTPDEVKYVDAASANIESLHNNVSQFGSVLHPVFGTYLCNSASLHVRNSLRDAVRGIRQTISRRRGAQRWSVVNGA